MMTMNEFMNAPYPARQDRSATAWRAMVDSHRTVAVIQYAGESTFVARASYSDSGALPARPSREQGLHGFPVVQVLREIPNRVGVSIVGHVVLLQLAKVSRFPASVARRDPDVALNFLLKLSELDVPLQQLL